MGMRLARLTVTATGFLLATALGAWLLMPICAWSRLRPTRTRPPSVR